MFDDLVTILETLLTNYTYKLTRNETSNSFLEAATSNFDCWVNFDNYTAQSPENGFSGVWEFTIFVAVLPPEDRDYLDELQAIADGLSLQRPANSQQNQIEVLNTDYSLSDTRYILEFKIKL